MEFIWYICRQWKSSSACRLEIMRCGCTCSFGQIAKAEKKYVVRLSVRLTSTFWLTFPLNFVLSGGIQYRHNDCLVCILDLDDFNWKWPSLTTLTSIFFSIQGHTIFEVNLYISVYSLWWYGQYTWCACRPWWLPLKYDLHLWPRPWLFCLGFYSLCKAIPFKKKNAKRKVSCQQISLCSYLVGWLYCRFTSL